MNASSFSISWTTVPTFFRPAGPGVLSRMRRHSAANCSRVMAMISPPHANAIKRVVRCGMGHDLPGEPLTRRAVLGLMAAAAAAPSPAGASSSLLARPIPSSGERIPVVGLGTWRTFDVGSAPAERAPLKTVLQRFVELGGRVLDSSPMYGNAESVAGDLAAELSVTDKLFFASKVWTSGYQAGVQQIEQSFRRFRTKRVDLLQIHNLLDWQTHLRTLRDFKQTGRIRYLGVTHYTAGAYDELERVLRGEALDFVQVNYSVGEREAERRILPLAAERGIAVLVNRPF